MSTSTTSNLGHDMLLLLVDSNHRAVCECMCMCAIIQRGRDELPSLPTNSHIHSLPLIIDSNRNVNFPAFPITLLSCATEELSHRPLIEVAVPDRTMTFMLLLADHDGHKKRSGKAVSIPARCADHRRINIIVINNTTTTINNSMTPHP